MSPLLRRLLRLLATVLHLIGGALLVLLFFPCLDRAARGRIVRAWARACLALQGIELSVEGRPPASCGGFLLVANHVSWLDVWLIHSQCPCRFVAKAEVRDWPLLGWLAARTGTLFIARERRHQAARLAQALASALAEDDCVALFPEATTSDGTSVRPFHAALFEAAIVSGRPIRPVALAYLDEAGRIDASVAFVGDTSLWQSYWRLAGRARIRARLVFLPVLASRGMERRALARTAENSIRAALGLAPRPERDPAFARAAP